MNEYTFEVVIPEGLHARPCAKIVDILKEFEPVHITYKDHTITILSMLELLLQKIGFGSVVTISTGTPLTPLALAALREVFCNEAQTISQEEIEMNAKENPFSA